MVCIYICVDLFQKVYTTSFIAYKNNTHIKWCKTIENITCTWSGSYTDFTIYICVYMYIYQLDHIPDLDMFGFH